MLGSNWLILLFGEVLWEGVFTVRTNNAQGLTEARYLCREEIAQGSKEVERRETSR